MLNLLECHVTVRQPETAELSELFEDIAAALKWKTSEIQRDPLLGKATYFYFTSHSAVQLLMFNRMRELLRELKAHGVFIVREKVEAIIYDRRYKEE